LCRNALLLAAQLPTRQIGHDIILHTIEKTTLPDADKRARVAAAVIASTRQQANTALIMDETGHIDKAARDRVSREDRAAQLLLRAAREKQGPEPQSP
jgi:hypothetical protein